MKQILIIATIFVALFTVSRADLPVHCLKRQIVGRWQFDLTDPVTKSDNEMVPCGHSQPDSERTSHKAMSDNFVSTSNIDVTLVDTFEASSRIGGKDQNGRWTLIYDEGFEVTVGDYKFFAFSKYQKNGHEMESVCDQTLVGWYNNQKTGEKGCLKGHQPGAGGNATQNVHQDKVVQPEQAQKADDSKKVKKADEQVQQSQQTQERIEVQEAQPAPTLDLASNQEDLDQDEFLSTEYSFGFEPEPEYKLTEADILHESFIFAQTGKTHNKKHHKKEERAKVEPKEKLHTEHKHHQKEEKTHLRNQNKVSMHKQSKEHHKLVKELNKVQKDWQAKVPTEFADLTVEEMNRRAGRIRHHGKASPFQISFVQTKQDYSNYSAEDLSHLPKEFSWEETLNPAISQRDCGSCYAIATSEMYSARLKIHYQEDVKISPQHSLDCNYYNQGCDGGYGYLVSKFASEYELVPEECHPYKAYNGKCSDACDLSTLQKTYKVSDYKYIGGAYGKSSERQMMEEMKENGPIVVSFEPTQDFMYYDSGIYHSVDAEEWIMDHESQPIWEKVDHSVLAYGWGEENGKKYWKVLNSWGKNWGENGHFRIRRGTDESHIESMGESAMPYIYKQK